MPCARGRQRRVAGRRRAERIEAGGQMSVAPDGLGEVRGADDDVDVVASTLRRQAGRFPTGADRPRLSAPIGRPRLERLARRRIDRLGILPVSLVELQNVPGVHSRELAPIS